MADTIQMDYFTFDGTASSDFEMYIMKNVNENSIGISYEEVEIPARNGSLIYDNKRFKNVKTKYNCLVMNAQNNIPLVRDWLCSNAEHSRVESDVYIRDGGAKYRRLEDTLHENEFYSAIFDGEFNPRFSKDGTLASVEIAFNRKPQRFLTDGEEETAFVFDGEGAWELEIENETNFEARPLFKFVFENEGNVYLNSIYSGFEDYIEINGVAGDVIYVDAETEEVYYSDGTSASNFYSSTDFIVFPSKVEDTITVIDEDNVLSSVTCVARWWHL